MPKKLSLNQASLNRRSFLRTSAAAAAGLALARPYFSTAKGGALAADGGAKTVTFPDKEHAAVTRWPRYGEEERKAVCACVESGGSYSELPLFEKEWKEYLGASHVKSHMNGTSALTAMYFALSLDLPPGSEIMVPSYTFFATIAPLRFFQFVPIFVDSDPKTACFDLEDAKRKLTTRTKAMVPMHSWGLPCEMDRINDFAKEKGLIVCEDCAHAHGASIGGKKVGTLSSMAIYSFQQSKVMPLIEGGAGVYATKEYYERATTFGHYSVQKEFPANSAYRKYGDTGFGQKYRMHPMAAAIGRVQLRQLDAMNALVEKNVRALNSRLIQLPGLREPFLRPDMKRVYYNMNQLFIDPKKAGFTRDQAMKALGKEGVQFGGFATGYPEQHKFPLYSEAKWWHHPPVIPASMPGCEEVNKNCLHLKLIYEDKPELLDQYAKAFEKVWANKEAVAKLSI